MTPEPLLHRALAGVYVGSPQTVGDLAIVPLFIESGEADADFLEEALARGKTEVSEVSEGGRVGTLRVKHGGDRLLLLVDGEQVLGAKQNRVFNASFLIPPGAVVDLPVSCVERGRWSYEAPEFRASGTTLSGNARSSKLARVAESTRAGRGYDADQGAVWKDVDGYLERTQVGSPTAAYMDGFASRVAEVERQRATLEPAPGQVGVAGVRGGALIGLDLFGSPALFARGWSKVVRGLLGEVYGPAVAHADPAGVVRRCLMALAGAPLDRRGAPGCGVTFHGTAGGFVVGGVSLGDSVYHLLAASTA